MNTSVSRRIALTLLASVSAATCLQGCAVMGSSAGPEHLLSRANAYWAAVQTNDNVTAWPYEEYSKDPGWTLQTYLQLGGIKYDAVEVRDVKQIGGDRALVNVWMKYSVPLIKIKGREAVFQDEWRLIDGQWYHVLSKDSMFKSK